MNFSRKTLYDTKKDLSVYEWWIISGSPRRQIILSNSQKNYQAILNPRGNFNFYPEKTRLQVLGIGDSGLGPVDPHMIKGQWEEVLSISVTWNSDGHQ